MLLDRAIAHILQAKQTQSSERTPVRSPVRQSPRYRNLDTTSSSSQRTPGKISSQRTPGKISAYFRSNGMLSAEKRNVEQSPVRQSPRLNKVSSPLSYPTPWHYLNIVSAAC